VRRVATASGGELRVVDLGEDGEGGISVQRASSAAAPDARVYVDAATDAVALALDGAEVGGVPAGEQRSLYLPAGAWRLGARRGGVESAVARELAAGRRYAWTPGAGRAYAIDYERYGPAFLGDKGETPTPRSARGLELFEVRTDFAFEPFPDQVRTAFGTATTRSRLGLGAVAPREEVVAGYDALLARAKEALSEDALAALEVRLPKVDRATLSDLDLGLAEGLLDEALGDREAAEDRYTDAIAFAPDDARLLSLRGRVRSALGRIDGAREDLEAAVAKDPSLEAALAPAIAEAKAAIERREAAQRKAAEDAAAAEKRELRDEARRRVDAVPEDTSDLEARARKALPAEVIATFLDLLHGRKAGGDGPRAEARLLTLGGALGLLEPEARAPTDFYAAAIDADASYADVHALQAAEWISLNDEDAARELETASRLAPEKAEAWRPLLERERAKAEERRKLLEPPKEEGGE
jgi:tetratricopeptide (TPR) repeat protein